MRAGLVGFAGGGKSTLFELLTGATPDPGKVHSGQVGIATLGDPRLDYLAAMHKPKKVTPATVETPILAQVSQAHIDYMRSKIPMERFGTVDEMAAIIAWLASEECSFTTGAVFDVSGGRATY